MSEIVIKLPDIGEGIVEAEISEWNARIGDLINEDDVIGVVLTDKAAVEIPSSVSGKVLWRAGDEGDMLAIGAPFVKIDVTEAKAKTAAQKTTGAGKKKKAKSTEKKNPKIETVKPAEPQRKTNARSSTKVLAAAAVRKRAADLGVDLSAVTGSGPEGRVTHTDLDRRIADGSFVSGGDTVTQTKVVGLRRKIAEQLSIANANIPSITIVEETDVTELERLRTQMNADRDDAQPKLSMLPFLVRGVIVARDAAPQVNARYDGEAGILSTHEAVHFGIAAQTDRGLMVPVVRHAEGRSVWNIAAEIERLSKGARDGSLSRSELMGSTITITSLGPLGALASTPIINQPEVAIVGINRKQVRPFWDGRNFQPREMMNISASFDHRIVDGWDAAVFVARFKQLIETPALLFA